MRFSYDANESLNQCFESIYLNRYLKYHFCINTHIFKSQDRTEPTETTSSEFTGCFEMALNSSIYQLGQKNQLILGYFEINISW